MVLQQYIGETNAKPSLAELNARLHHKTETEEPPSCALTEAVKAVKELKKSPDDTIPPGSVFLARGGLLLEETRKLKANSEVEEGEVVDLSLYPVLRPILDSTFSSPKASTHDDAPTSPTLSPILSPNGSYTGVGSALIVPKEVGSVVTSSDNSPRSDAGSEQESPHTFSLARVASTSFSSKSNSGRYSAKLNWADFSSTLAPTLPAEAVASPARVGKLATSVPPSHVVVLQHGFLGQSYDMQLIENAIRLEFPGRIEVSFISNPC